MRILKNLALWLVALALYLVLYSILYPQKVQNIQNILQPPKAQNNSLSALMQEKDRIEQQIAALDAQEQAVRNGASSVFVVFTTTDETIIREAGMLMDEKQCPGALGVTESDLFSWREQGVPAYIQERLEQGWELCLMLNDSPMVLMEALIKTMDLPQARLGYQLGNTPDISQSKLLIMLDQGVQIQEEADDGLWHLPAVGSMNPAAQDVYNEKKGAASGVAFLIGNHDADQRYNRDNLVALLDLIETDRADQMMQCVSAQMAYTQHKEREAKLLSLQEQWDRSRMELNQQLDTVMNKINILIKQ